MAPPPRRSRRLALKRVALADLPPHALHHILLTATTHDNLLRFVAACARVCGEWWRAVGGSAAYGRGLGAGAERWRVLKDITAALEGQGGELDLRNKSIGDAGAAALGAALLAVPTIRFTALDLDSNELTVAGVTSLAPALRRPWGAAGLRVLNVKNNPSLGDAGVAALAKALPPTLRRLLIGSTGCGDDGLVALAAALPASTHFQMLGCNRNPAACARGWAALAGALPSLPALKTLGADGCTGMGSEGAAALAAAMPQCPRLQTLWVVNCGANEQAKAALRAAAESVPRSAERPGGLRVHGLGESGPEF
eukprot:COSAG04_NODE_423_length_14604_cov_8.047777_3_plen_310_part_00